MDIEENKHILDAEEEIRLPEHMEQEPEPQSGNEHPEIEQKTEKQRFVEQNNYETELFIGAIEKMRGLSFDEKEVNAFVESQDKREQDQQPIEQVKNSIQELDNQQYDLINQAKELFSHAQESILKKIQAINLTTDHDLYHLGFFVDQAAEATHKAQDMVAKIKSLQIKKQCCVVDESAYEDLGIAVDPDDVFRSDAAIKIIEEKISAHAKEIQAIQEKRFSSVRKLIPVFSDKRKIDDLSKQLSALSDLRDILKNQDEMPASLYIIGQSAINFNGDVAEAIIEKILDFYIRQDQQSEQETRAKFFPQDIKDSLSGQIKDPEAFYDSIKELASKTDASAVSYKIHDNKRKAFDALCSVIDETPGMNMSYESKSDVRHALKDVQEWFTLSDEQELGLPSINEKEWIAFKENKQARQFFEQETGAHMEDAEARISKAIAKSMDSENSERLSWKLIRLKNAIAAPYLLVGLLQNKSKLYTNSPLRTEFAEYIQSISHEEIAQKTKQGEPGFGPDLEDAMRIIQENQDTYYKDDIQNPDIEAFKQEIQNDPEFIDLIVRDKVDSPFEMKASDDSNKRNVWSEMVWRLKESTFRKYVPDISSEELKSLRQGIKEDNPLYKKIIKAMVREYLSEYDIRGHDDHSNLAPNKHQYFLSEKDEEYFLKKLGYADDLFKYIYIRNPIANELNEKIGAIALEFLKDKETQTLAVGYITAKPELLDEKTKDALARIFSDALPDEEKASIQSIALSDFEQGDGRFIVSIAKYCYKGSRDFNNLLLKAGEKLLEFPEEKIQSMDAELFSLISNSYASNPDVFKNAVLFVAKYAGKASDVLHQYVYYFRDPETAKILQDMDTRMQNPQDSISAFKDFYINEYMIDFFREHPDKYQDALSLAEEGHLNNKSLQQFVLQSLEKIVSLPREKREHYIMLMQKVDQSPSQEIQHLKNQLLAELADAEDPEKAFKEIEDIFIKNNLPIAGKVYKVFQVMYPPEKMEQALISLNLSPVLTQSRAKARYYTVYRDLLKTHIQTGNQSLKNYLEVLHSGQHILDRADQNGIDSLEELEKKELGAFLAKMETLFANSLLGKRCDRTIDSSKPLEERYAVLREELGCAQDQPIAARISELFLKPIGMRSAEQVLEAMAQSKEQANARSRAMAHNAQDNKLEIEPGDLLKGVNPHYIEDILQNGSVAKEYLGASAVSDQTPFDTDLSLVEQKDIQEDGFKGAVEESIAKTHGDLLFVIKDRGQFQRTNKEEKTKYDSEKYELFQTGGSKHYGIRTGFPATEIDFMVVKGFFAENDRQIEDLYIEIAQNGYYIPITNEAGEIIFSLQDFEAYRSIYAGLDRFEGAQLAVMVSDENDANYHEISDIAKKIEDGRQAVEQASNKVQEIIKQALSNSAIELKDKFDSGILGAQMYDTGSTGRHTNLSDNFDFDFAVRVDDKDFEKVGQVVAEIIAHFNPEENGSHSDEGGKSYQLRAFKVSGIANEPIDVDITFVNKSSPDVFGSHGAAGEKLEHIKQTQGEDAYTSVLANIVLAKTVLKQGEAYKKLEHGGIGGIGVENWILENKGNAIEAFQSFYRSAHDKSGTLLPFDEFQKNYKIIDPGINVKFGRHDNFLYVLKSDGYVKMNEVIEKYLREHAEL